MIAATRPDDEEERLAALDSYAVLDTEPDPELDQLVHLARRITSRPIALVSLVDRDRQWFKARAGLEATETPREVAFCAHAILQDGVFEVADARRDPRFHDNPLVRSGLVAAYAGVPLTNPDGHNLGTLCVIDHRPSLLTAEQRATLEVLARQVVAQLELGRSARLARERFEELALRSDELQQLAYRTSHDLRAPVLQIEALARLILADLDAEELDEVRSNCRTIVQTCRGTKYLVDAISELARAGAPQQSTEEDLEQVTRRIVAEQVAAADGPGLDVRIEVPPRRRMRLEFARIEEILRALISNAIRFRDPKRPRPGVHIAWSEEGSRLRLVVRDNGRGIPDAHPERAFEAFRRYHPEVLDGAGLGLFLLQKHVLALGGRVAVTSSPAGTVFTVDLPSRRSLEMAS